MKRTLITRITGQGGDYLGKDNKIFLTFGDKMNKNLVTGGAGFIGSNFIRYMLNIQIMKLLTWIN